MLAPASAKLTWSHCCRSVCTDCCEAVLCAHTSESDGRRSVDAEAEPCGMGRVAQSSEDRGRVAADEEWQGMERVAQSAEEAVSLRLVESAAGRQSPAQPCIDA